jgi:hypothetical protein
MFILNERTHLMYIPTETALVNTAQKEAELLQRALEVFHDTTGLQIAVEATEAIGNAGGYQPDALVRLTAPGVDRQFVVEVKRGLTQAALGTVVHRLERFGQKGLIVADYVNPRMAERLKEMGMPFLDLAGNAYLDEPPLFIYIKGNKPAEKAARQAPTRAFQTTGLKVLFALLCDPELAGAPYRDIATAAGVALGTVGWVITDLKALGFLVEMGKRGRRLANKEKLIERWVTAYPEQLRPKLVTGRYRAADPHWWEQARVRNFQACWGGEVAAAKLTQYLKPEQLVIYARGKTGELLLANGLKKDPDGDVEILEAFWQACGDWPHPELAPPLLIYADLLATGDARNIETARIVYEQELAGVTQGV